MAELSVVGSHYWGLGARAFDGISDLEIYERDGITYLLIANEGSGHVQMYRLYGDQVMTFEDLESAKDTTGTFTLSEIDVIMIDDEDFVLTSGRYDDNAGLISLSGPTPMLRLPQDVTGDADDYANFTRTLVVVIGGKTFVFAAKRNDSHLYSYLVQEDGQFIAQAVIADMPETTLGDISDMVSMVIDGKNFIAVTSAFYGGVSLFRVSANGVLSHRDTVFPSDGGGFRFPQEVSVVQSGGQDFLIMTSAGSSTLTVYKISDSGRLRQVDHQIDTLNTRFEGADQIASIEHEGRSFIFVAGNDDGITVFELMPDGTLLHAMTLEDDFEIALTNVTAISVAIIDGEIHVFVSGAEDGITQFIFDPDALGAIDVGTAGKDVMIGTAFDDYLFGGRRGDTIDGGAGDDRIDGGGGKDYLTGGAGADTFVFVADGRNDFIMDFEDGIDRIDLSGYHQIGTIDDLTIKTREWGVLIEIRGEKLKVIAAEGETISAENFTADDFIF